MYSDTNEEPVVPLIASSGALSFAKQLELNSGNKTILALDCLKCMLTGSQNRVKEK